MARNFVSGGNKQWTSMEYSKRHHLAENNLMQRENETSFDIK